MGDLVEPDHLCRAKLTGRLNDQVVPLVSKLWVIFELVMGHAVDEWLFAHSHWKSVLRCTVLTEKVCIAQPLDRFGNIGDCAESDLSIE